MAKFETMRYWYQSFELEQKIIEQMELGWKVLYAVPVWTPPQQNPAWSGGSSTTYSTINPDGSVSIHVAPPPPQPYQCPPQIEVCFYKKDWKQDPCPRCSYPFPDPERIDREV